MPFATLSTQKQGGGGEIRTTSPDQFGDLHQGFPLTRVTRPGGWVAVTNADSHTYEWMRSEQADLWLGFSPDETAGFFADARLLEYGHTSLGMQ